MRAVSSETILLIQKQLLAWYGVHQRQLPWRKTQDPFAIWVSEVMLQQTRVNTVIPYYLKFMKAFPSVSELVGADLETVLKVWEGLGYYSRARNLHKAACQVTNSLSGIIPDKFTPFKRLPGVGDYIASAVQSIAFGNCHAVVDGNVKRVLARIFCLDNPVNHQGSQKIFASISKKLLNKNDPGTFNQALMELGALVCTPKNPRCRECPVAGKCEALATHTTDRFPLRIPSKKIPCHRIGAGIVRKNECFLITRRKLNGLLGGLWEFPGGKCKTNETTSSACLREIREETGLEVKIDSFLTRVTHAYTHFKIEMDVFYCEYISGDITLTGPIDYKWIELSDIHELPFPRANLKFIPLIQTEKIKP